MMGSSRGAERRLTADAARFASTAARALQGRLRAMMLSLAVVDDHVSAPALSREAIKQQVAVMYSHMFWLQQHAENMLLAEALVEGEIPLNRRPTDLRDLAEDVHVVMEPVLAERNQVLLMAIPEDLPWVTGDARWLCHALFNLLANAAKYSPNGATIEVLATARPPAAAEGGRRSHAALIAPLAEPKPQSAVRITVADRGPGIDPHAPLPFNPTIYRGSEERGATPGLGFGLPAVRCIVHAHGGRVGAHNRPGGGAIFWMELPALVAHP
jgi:signal transduction histidine kinase